MFNLGGVGLLLLAFSFGFCGVFGLCFVSVVFGSVVVGCSIIMNIYLSLFVEKINKLL